VRFSWSLEDLAQWRWPHKRLSDRHARNQPPRNISVIDFSNESVRAVSLHEMHQWEQRWQRLLFRTLLPPHVLTALDINPLTLCTPDGHHALTVFWSAEGNACRLVVRHRPEAEDPLIELEMNDTPFNYIMVAWLNINDLSAPRFDVDKGPDGEPNWHGSGRRNIAAEIAAMEAGLAPGQVRRGLRLLGRLLSRLETFMTVLNQEAFVAEPLTYHNAILLERAGFAYVQGRQKMARIHAGFQPGGELYARLDGSTPFRHRGMAESIRGRSWAIHDGILGEPWDGVKMVKRVGQQAGENSAPGIPW